MALGKAQLLEKLSQLGIVHETISHALSPTCEIHSENIKGTSFEKYIGKGQAKNLFFKVPSGGGPLKNRLFLVCALVETAIDNKVLSERLGIKQSAPLRFAADELFTDVLQIPKGSVNPFVMAQSSCDEVVLLLDEQFLHCEALLFHPMQSDFTTALAPAQLSEFLQQVAPGRFQYVDLSTTAKISLPDLSKVQEATKSKGKAPKAAPTGNVHGFCDDTLPEALKGLSAPIIVDPVGKLNAAGRLEGHSTHNFFVHDKKDKEKRMLVTVAQNSLLDMKAIPGLVGCKEVRLCSEGDTLLGSTKGCVTPISLFYDRSKKVQWFVDGSLLADSSACWRLGTSGDGPNPGTVANVPLATLAELLAPTGHWNSKKVLDCSAWAVAATAVISQPPTSVSEAEPDFSTWYQPPYQTVMGRVL